MNNEQVRTALQSLYEMTSRYAISDSDYGIVCNAASALASSATPERSGESVDADKALMQEVLTEIFNRRPCDYNLDFKAVREADNVSMERVRHLMMPNFFPAPAAHSSAPSEAAIANVILKLIGAGHMDWCSTDPDYEGGDDGGFNDGMEEHAVLCDLVRKALAAPTGESLSAASVEIVADWPACNPACDYEDPHGGQHDCRSNTCSCDAAKASIARQRAALAALPPSVQGVPEGWHDTDPPKNEAAFYAFHPSLVEPDFNPWGVVEACFNGEEFIGAVWNNSSDCWDTLPIEITMWRRITGPTPTGASK